MWKMKEFYSVVPGGMFTPPQSSIEMGDRSVPETTDDSE